jgi:hypothetical protein
MVVEESGTAVYIDWGKQQMCLEVQVDADRREIWEGPLEVTIGTSTVTVHREDHEDLVITPTLIESMPTYDIPMGTRDIVRWTAESNAVVRHS